MPNPDYNEDFNMRKQASPAKRRTFHGKATGFIEKTAAWGALPGKPSKDRSGGTKKIKQHPVSKGL